MIILNIQLFNNLSNDDNKIATNKILRIIIIILISLHCYYY